MAKVTGIDFVAVQVRDLEKSKAFYTDILGLEVLPNSPPGAYVLETTPVPFAIREPQINLDDASRLGWGVVLWMQCDNADALSQRLEANHVTIVRPLFDTQFGRTVGFYDPDGYFIMAHTPTE